MKKLIHVQLIFANCFLWPNLTAHAATSSKPHCTLFKLSDYTWLSLHTLRFTEHSLTACNLTAHPAVSLHTLPQCRAPLRITAHCTPYLTTTHSDNFHKSAYPSTPNQPNLRQSKYSTVRTLQDTPHIITQFEQQFIAYTQLTHAVVTTEYARST